MPDSITVLLQILSKLEEINKRLTPLCDMAAEKRADDLAELETIHENIIKWQGGKSNA